MKRFIIVRTSFEGFHCWKDAPIEVGFLRNLHRHIFHVEVKIEVPHNNRALEFFIVQHFLEDYIQNQLPEDRNLKQTSCEMLAEGFCEAIKTQYRIKKGITVTVFEDNENGGGVEV
jgi:hypothetical protein